jgi:hypothetical protein
MNLKSDFLLIIVTGGSTPNYVIYLFLQSVINTCGNINKLSLMESKLVKPCQLSINLTF